MDFGTHSNDSALHLNPRRSTVMLACWMGRNVAGQQDGGKDPVWNVPGNGSPVP